MRWRDLVPGTTVYHKLMTHWGAGKVADRRREDSLGYPTAYRIRIEWPDKPEGDKLIWCRMSDLRKTPNLKRAASVAHIKARRIPS